MSDGIRELSQALARFARRRDWEQFHSPKNLAMGLTIEAAEVAEIFQWLTEEQSKRLPAARKEHLGEELADVFMYLLKLADAHGIDLIEASRRKLAKNGKKYPVAKAKGSAKKYNEL
jgi:NTP pyrophosphatase (non-canonical NTP hydrolase)